MSKLQHKLGVTSVILRVFIQDKTQTDGRGLTGLVFNTTGLIISTIAQNEATPTVYTTTGGTIETITTLGTFAAPTATKCRFKEIDATNLPGMYEIQFADTRFAVSSARSLQIMVHGATNAAAVPAEIQFVSYDPYNATDLGVTRIAAGAIEAGILDLANGVWTGTTLRQWLRKIGSAMAGKATAGGSLAAGTATLTLRDFADSKDVIVFAVKIDGTRTISSEDLT